MSRRDRTDEWQGLAPRVEQEFLKLTSAERTRDAMVLLDRWMSEDLFDAQRSAVMAHIEQGKYGLLLESFYQFMPFGTGGRRGRVGFGPNRINEATVALSVQGHCNFLHKKYGHQEAPLSVVVACDVRIFKDLCKMYAFLPENPLLDFNSRGLAKTACEIYAGNGVECYFVRPEEDLGYLSTPELSFLIRSLGALGGVNMSASHNHPDDNGYKFYNADGAQDIPPHDEELARFMNDPGEVIRIPYRQALGAGLVKAIPAEAHAHYLRASLEVDRGPQVVLGKDSPPIVYTPLCGTGTTTLAEVLRAAGHNLILHEPQAMFDGTFASVPFGLPNPEIPQAAWPAIETAERCGASVVLSTDPDADRLGVIAKAPDGAWTHLNGNEIASMLAYYLILDEKRGPRRKGVLLTTVVTTSLLEKIAREGGCTVLSDLLIGFKFFAQILGAFDKEGRFRDVQATADDLVLAAEESHGFLVTPKIRDKDAAGAALVLCDLVAKLAHEGLSLADYLDEVAARCGTFGNTMRSIFISGMKGTDDLKALMRAFRKDPPQALDGKAVIGFRDFLSDRPIGGLPEWPDVEIESSEDKASNLLFLRFEDGRVVVRPSGTEPKLKIYAEVQTPDANRQEANDQAYGLATVMYRECLRRLGPDYGLSRAAEFIPDHIEVNLKRQFDADFTPDLLQQAAQLAAMDDAARQQWFRKQLDLYGGGADPLAVMRPALLELCESPPAGVDDVTRDALGSLADWLTETPEA